MSTLTEIAVAVRARRADCDCCGQRPGVRTVFACGIETNVCGPCGGDCDELEDLEPEQYGSFEQMMEDLTGKPSTGPL